MVFGFERVPGVIGTREIEDNLFLALGDLDERAEAWLITPYLTIDKLSSLRRQITEACKRGANVNVVVRDEPDQVNPARSGLSEALAHGLNLYAFNRLHAKVYWFENHLGIVTSANLVDGSFEKSTEIGVIADPGSFHDEIRGWIEKIIEPELRAISTPNRSTPKATRPKAATRTSSGLGQKGHCIRCGSTIPLNPERPYCLEHYRVWAQYSNPDYSEKFCHACGKSEKTSMSKPICYECYKRHGK